MQTDIGIITEWSLIVTAASLGLILLWLFIVGCFIL